MLCTRCLAPEWSKILPTSAQLHQSCGGAIPLPEDASRGASLLLPRASLLGKPLQSGENESDGCLGGGDKALL